MPVSPQTAASNPVAATGANAVSVAVLVAPDAWDSVRTTRSAPPPAARTEVTGPSAPVRVAIACGPTSQRAPCRCRHAESR
jgi:hypothetical protein